MHLKHPRPTIKLTILYRSGKSTITFFLPATLDTCTSSHTVLNEKYNKPHVANITTNIINKAMNTDVLKTKLVSGLDTLMMKFKLPNINIDITRLN